MIYPPIDKLIDKVGCKYALVTLVSKRAQALVEKNSVLLEESKLTPLTYAAKEVYEDKISANYDE